MNDFLAGNIFQYDSDRCKDSHKSQEPYNLSQNEVRNAQSPDTVLLLVENAEYRQQCRRSDHVHEATVNVQRTEQ